MAKGARVIDLRFSGRNLTAPPEGYSARSEANVKRWIAALPIPESAAPDDTVTIVDEPDADVEDGIFYDARCSGDSFLLKIRADQEEVTQDCTKLSCTVGDLGEMEIASPGYNDAGMAVPQLETCEQRTESLHLGALQEGSVGKAPMADDAASCTTAQTAVPSEHVSSESNKPDDINGHQACVSATHAPSGALAHHKLGHMPEAAALEVGVLRYIGMAEAVHGDDVQLVLRHALELAVEDRIRSRMQHMEQSAELHSQSENFRLKSQSLELAAERIKHLEDHVSDLHSAMQKLKLSAQDDVNCVRQHLEQAQDTMKATNANLTARVTELKHCLSNNEGMVMKLKDREHTLSLQLSHADHSNVELRQALTQAEAEASTLQAELKDNVGRWERECAARLEAEAALRHSQASLVQAQSAATAADDRANKSIQKTLEATQQLSLASARRGSLLALERAVTGKHRGACKAQHAHTACTQSPAVPRRPQASYRDTQTVWTAATDYRRQRHSKPEAAACTEHYVLPNDVNQGTTPSDGVLAEMGGELVQVALQRAPAPLKVLGLAFRCLVICPQDSCHDLAYKIANDIGQLYQTLVCMLWATPLRQCKQFDDVYASSQAAKTPAAAAHCAAANTDEHAVAVLLPVSHTAIFLPDATDDGDGPCQRLVYVASKCGCKIVIIKQPSTQPDDDMEELGVQVKHGPNDRPLVKPETHLCIFAEVRGGRSLCLSHEQREEMLSDIGVPDIALQYLSNDALQSCLPTKKPNSCARQIEAPEVIDLATFRSLRIQKLVMGSRGNFGLASGNCERPTEASRYHASRSPADVASCLDLACLLLGASKRMHRMDLSCVSIGVHGAKSLAAVILSGSSVTHVTLKEVPLPVAVLLGRTGSDSKAPKTDELDLPGSKLIEEDLILLAEFFKSGAIQTSIQAVLIRGHVAVAHSVLEDFASAVAGVQHICSVQGFRKHQMEAINGVLCLSEKQVDATTDSEYASAGPFGVLVAARVLLNFTCQAAKDTDLHCHFDDNTLDGALCDAGEPTAPLSSIDLSGTQGGSYANAQIAAAISQRGAASHLRLCLAGTMPGAEGCQAWAHAVINGLGSSLTDLNLSSNSIDDVSMERLAPMFGACNQLKRLNLSSNTIGRAGSLLLCKYLAVATPLTSLSMARMRLPDAAGAAVSSLLLPCTACQLAFLDMSQNFSLDHATATKLSQALEYNTTLQELRLSNCQLGATAMDIIAKSSQAHPCLSVLNISGCKIGCEGILELSGAWTSNSMITNLNVSKNTLGDRGAAGIATLMCDMKLQVLDVSFNQIGMAGAKILAQSLQRCKDLRCLRLEGNNLGDHGAGAIIRQAFMLSEVVLSSTGMTAAGLTQIASWMLSNAAHIHLQHLDVSKNAVGDKAVHQLCAAISSCSQMHSIDLSACQLGSTSGRKIFSMLQSLADSAASCNRVHSLQEITLVSNPRLDAVLLSSVQQLLCHRRLSNSTKGPRCEIVARRGTKLTGRHQCDEDAISPRRVSMRQGTEGSLVHAPTAMGTKPVSTAVACDMEPTCDQEHNALVLGT